MAAKPQCGGTKTKPLLALVHKKLQTSHLLQMSEGEFAMDTSDLSFYQMEQASARKPGLELIPMVMEEVEVTTDQPTAEGLLLEQCLQDAASLQVPQQGEPQQVEEHMVELELDPEDDARSVATSHTTATVSRFASVHACCLRLAFAFIMFACNYLDSDPIVRVCIISRLG